MNKNLKIKRVKGRFGTQKKFKCPTPDGNRVVWYFNKQIISHLDRMGLFKFRGNSLILDRLVYEDEGLVHNILAYTQ